MPDFENEPVGRYALATLLRPTRTAMVGASDKSLFSRRAWAQQQRVAPKRAIPLVNPKSAVVHETKTFPSCTAIPGGVDSVFLMTPVAATEDALRDAAAAGARGAVVISQGWSEEGEQGALRQRSLVSVARQLGITLLGPNHLGFANLWDAVAPCALGLELPVEPGQFALVTQSGAVGSSMMGYAARHGVRFSFVVTTGNEAMVSIADVVDYLVEDEHTRSIGVFAEMIRKPELFRKAARRAAELGKAIVVLKAGSSELAARTAAAHTGALVGDDRVTDAVLRQDGIIRVRTVEDLICTGALAASTGPLRAPGVGILSASGGACDLIADRGAEVGLELPELSADTVAGLSKILPSYAHPQNPLDVTGGAVTDAGMWERGVELIAGEAAVGLVGVVTSLPTPGQTQREDTFHSVGRAMRATGVPCAILPQLDQPHSDYIRAVMSASGIDLVLPGVDRFTTAAAGLGRWSKWLLNHHASTTSVSDRVPTPAADLPAAMSEWDARSLLESAGVPFVPAQLATSADDAASAAASIGGRVVVKLCSREVAHKSEIGGVELDLRGTEDVRGAFTRMEERAKSANVVFEGVLVSPMRDGGLELLVGATHDPTWGTVLAVALGGVFVELLQDSVLRVLPVDEAEVRTMLRELRGAAAFDGFRGGEAVALDRVAHVISRFGGFAYGLGSQLEAIEINPLLVAGERVEALDVLITPAGDRSGSLLGEKAGEHRAGL